MAAVPGSDQAQKGERPALHAGCRPAVPAGAGAPGPEGTRAVQDASQGPLCTKTLVPGPVRVLVCLTARGQGPQLQGTWGGRGHTHCHSQAHVSKCLGSCTHLAHMLALVCTSSPLTCVCGPTRLLPHVVIHTHTHTHTHTRPPGQSAGARCHLLVNIILV